MIVSYGSIPLHELLQILLAKTKGWQNEQSYSPFETRNKRLNMGFWMKQNHNA